MKNLILILVALVSVVTISACSSSKKSGCGAPGITHSSRGGSMSSGPGITRSNNSGWGGHSPAVSGYKRRGDSMSGPTRQHGRR